MDPKLKGLIECMKKTGYNLTSDQLLELYEINKEKLDKLPTNVKESIVSSLSDSNVEALANISRQYKTTVLRVYRWYSIIAPSYSDALIARLTGKPKITIVKAPKGDKLAVSGYWYNLLKTSIPPELLNAKTQQQISKIENKVSFTALLRYAVISPEAAKYLKSKYDMHGLALLPPFELKPYQEEMVKYMMEREKITYFGIRGGIIAADPGTGKTLTATSLILVAPKHSFENTGIIFPTLIVCPKNLLVEWAANFKKFFRDLRVLYFHQDFLSAEQIKNMNRKKLLEFDIVVTTYDVCKQGFLGENPQVIKKETRFGGWKYEKVPKFRKYITREVGGVEYLVPREAKTANIPSETGKSIIYACGWQRVIMDETQLFAKDTTSIFESMMGIYGRNKWCLSGTPIKNNVYDLLSQLRVVGYVVPDYSKVMFKKDYYDSDLKQAIFIVNYIKNKIKMPPKIFHNIILRIEGKELEFQKELSEQTESALHKHLVGAAKGFGSVLALFTKMRIACIAPYIIAERCNESKEERKEMAAMLGIQPAKEDNCNIPKGFEWINDKKEAGYNSTKIKAVVNIVKKIPPTEKILIFCFFIGGLTVTREAIERQLPGIKTVTMTGSTTTKKKIAIREQFDNDPKCRIMFLQLNVGSVGLNLQVANHVIVLEPYWNAAIQQQAAARAWRNLQTKPVHIYNFIVENSIEKGITRMQLDKLKIAKNYLEGGEYEIESVKLGVEEVKDILDSQKDDVVEGSVKETMDQISDLLKYSSP